MQEEEMTREMLNAINLFRQTHGLPSTEEAAATVINIDNTALVVAPEPAAGDAKPISNLSSQIVTAETVCIYVCMGYV